MQGVLRKLPIDTYMLMLLATILLATVLPVSGAAAKFVSQLSSWAVALLFFLYGAKLKTQAIVAGIANWRLQLLVVLTTFALFPLLGFGLSTLAKPWLPAELIFGFVYLSILPSTVQSSIALTALARGNVPAAICAASLSNILGVVFTPAFAALLLSTNGMKLDANAIIGICVQLLLPFVAGQIMRPLIGSWIEKNKMLTMIVDRGSILLIVYSAFSAGVVAGIWGKLDASTLALMIGLDLGLLLLVLFILKNTARITGLAREDEVSLLFCGSQKSLASGVPMANILFAGHATGLIILPLMLYHQFQLFICAAIAQRYAAAGSDAGAELPAKA
jgi:solute carrier family 10 (sodium/bile acid cotransporter), member 7